MDFYSILFAAETPDLEGSHKLFLLIAFLIYGESKSVKGISPHPPISNWLSIRAGPQNEKWSNRQNTSDPTGSLHKKARKKKFDPKKVDFDEGDCI